MAVTASLVGWWWCKLTLQSSGTDMVVADFVQHGQPSCMAGLLQGGPLQFFKRVLDARDVVETPKDISGSSTLHSLSFINGVLGMGVPHR